MNKPTNQFKNGQSFADGRNKVLHQNVIFNCVVLWEVQQDPQHPLVMCQLQQEVR